MSINSIQTNFNRRYIENMHYKLKLTLTNINHLNIQCYDGNQKVLL